MPYLKILRLSKVSFPFFGCLILIVNCRSVQVQTEPLTQAIDLSLNHYTTAVLNVRNHYSTTGEIIGKWPANTLVNCGLETVERVTIDGITARWYSCETKKLSGWVFSGYLSEYMIIELGKNNYLKNMGNDTGMISIELRKNGVFRLSLQSMLGKGGTPHSWTGQWQLKGKELVWKFDPSDISERILFYPAPDYEPLAGENPIKELGKRQYQMEMVKPTFFIWGVRCEVVKVSN